MFAMNEFLIKNEELIKKKQIKSFVSNYFPRGFKNFERDLVEIVIQRQVKVFS